MILSDINKFDVKTLKNGDVHISLKKSLSKKLEEIIKKVDFPVNIDYGNSYTMVEYKHGGYLFEFCVSYTKEIKSYIGSSYLNPEEASLIFTVTNISGLEIYDFKNNVIELSDEEYDDLTEILNIKLMGTKIES